MKHKFLLDINILYFAVKGVDEDRRPDDTCIELAKLILSNCHTIRMDDALLQRYKEHIDWLRADPRSMVEPLRVVISLLQNSRKSVLQKEDSPNLPPGIRVPQKDEYVVRAALLSQPTVVTCDRPLKRSINLHTGALGFKAIEPPEALELAKDH